jgi:adenylate cyclase class 2
MINEFEAKFLHIDLAAFRKQLQDVGAICTQPMATLRRTTFETPGNTLAAKGGWVRLRQEPGKVTLVYKQADAYVIDKVFEAPLEVNDFQAAQVFLESIGMHVKSHQVTRRETWALGGVEICLDEWPWLDPFAEVEGADEASVKQAAETLGLDWTTAKFGPAEVAYMDEYEVTPKEVNNLPQFDFDLPPPPWRRK